MNKHFVILFVFIFWLLSSQAVPAQTLPDPDSGKLQWKEDSVKTVTLPSDSFGALEEENVIHPEYRPSELVEKSAYPDHFDARENGWVTPVKNQKPYDLCWAESVMSAAESNLIKKGLADSDIDLSEVFPHYFQWHRVSDPLGLISEDKNLWHAYESYPGYMREWINSWSSGYRAVLLLSSWTGVVPEAIAPYPSENEDIAKYAIDPELAWDPAIAHLHTSYWISMNDTDAIKRMIMKKGSVVIAFNQNSSKYLNSENGAYYCPDSLYTNHLVAVVGWDDNYSSGNFLSDPGQNGAWLIKNSFGTEWGAEGYGWLSYADKTLSEDAFVFDFVPADNNIRNYQYDGTVSYSYLTDENSSSFAAANVFTAQDNEELTSVGFTTPSSYFSYTIKVYRGVKDSPESGILFSEQKGEALYAGFYTVDLEKPVRLYGGDRFSIVVEIQSDRKGGAYILTDRSVSYTVKPTSGENFVFQELISSSNPGESYYRTSSGKWIDCWNADPEKSLGNVRIKAFTRFRSYAVWKNAESASSDKSFSLYRLDDKESTVPNFNY